MAENKEQKMKEYDIDFLEKLNHCELRIVVAATGESFVATYEKERDVFRSAYCGYWYPPTHLNSKNTKRVYVLDLRGQNRVKLCF